MTNISEQEKNEIFKSFAFGSSLSLKAYCNYYTTQNSFLQGHSKVFNEKN